MKYLALVVALVIVSYIHLSECQSELTEDIPKFRSLMLAVPTFKAVLLGLGVFKRVRGVAQEFLKILNKFLQEGDWAPLITDLVEMIKVSTNIITVCLSENLLKCVRVKYEGVKSLISLTIQITTKIKGICASGCENETTSILSKYVNIFNTISQKMSTTKES
ncbi:uncharacterized protein LOC116805652 [Drosophila grimshawi]|uniref:uncharacterized protein LOC116805652 n=1 Tax=Drosophila grimshawi TaxID=7222 RepID=UPI0013EF175C|nr:uncharacterized protein LOC116805652 [Drosophila grimshawi]